MLKSSTTHTCFVYDPQDGTIVHIHKEFVLDGAVEPTPSGMEERARRSAAKSGKDVEQLRVLFADDVRLRGSQYRVDKKGEQLEPVEQ